MRKYLWYELKKNLWLFVLLTVALALPYCISMATLYRYTVNTETGNVSIWDPGLNGLYIGMVLLVIAAVVRCFSFKMDRRGVDCFFALPIKRWKQYLVRTLLGLCLVAVPVTIAYWSGFLVLALRPNNPYDLVWYVPAYFLMLFFGVCLFGFFSFVYTRANTIGDGLVYILAYMLVFYLISSALYYLSGTAFVDVDSYMDIFGGSQVIEALSWRIRRSDKPWNISIPYGQCVFPIVLGVLGYTLQFALLHKDKAENAGQVSESWFGYKTLIPVYVIFSTSIFTISPDKIGTSLVSMTVLAHLAYGAAIGYKRRTWVGWKYLIVILCAIAVSIAVGLYINYVRQNFY